MSYSQRLLHQGTSITRLAHQSRFSRVLDAIAPQRYDRVLDYGCGDGWLLRTAYERGLIQSGFGVDISDYMLSCCQQVFAEIEDFQFIHPDQMQGQIPPHSCDLILCTETLEHVGSAEQAIEQMLTYATPEAKIVISVPLEVGPSLLIKQIGRFLANLNGRYGYERYSLKELFSAVILWDAESFPSSHSEDVPLRSHKGFDYRNLEKILKQKAAIDRRLFSPFPLFGNLLNSTIVWVCRVP